MLSKLFSRIDEGRKDEFMKMMPQSIKGDPAEKTWGEQINWAMNVLKKQDRITWYLKILKGSILSMAVYQNDMPEDLKKIVDKDMVKLNATMPNINWKAININTLKSQLEHYLSLNLPAIEQIVFNKQNPHEIINDMAKVEQEWKQKQKRHIKSNEETGNEKILIDFGNGWVWMDLGTATCSIEGRAMGHCGNAGNPRETETILSLREKTPQGWKPHCTFILDTLHETLGEMKGFGNEKPGKQFHSYILKLLELPIIKGIKGGGYLPGHNFSVGDLTPAEQEELFKKKPEMAGFMYRFRKHGMNTSLIQKIGETLDDINDYARPQYTTSQPTDRFIIQDYDAKDSGHFDRSFDYYFNILTGDGFNELNIEVDRDEVIHFYESLPAETQQEIEDWFEKEYASAIEDNAGKYTTAFMIDTLKDEGDQVYDDMRSAVYSGRQSGVETQIYKDIKEYLDDPSDGITAAPIRAGGIVDQIHTLRSHNTGDDIESWGTEFWITPQLMCAILDNQLLLEYDNWSEFIDAYAALKPFEDVVPNYGYDEYDKKAAHEYFYENSELVGHPKGKTK